jgi:serine/threonine protein kinase
MGIAHGGQSCRTERCICSIFSIKLTYRWLIDLHPRNIVFATTQMSQKNDDDLLIEMNKPETGNVHAEPGHSLTPHLPRYLVSATSLPIPLMELDTFHVKLVDLGQAFLHGQMREIRCPLVFRAPEVILSDLWGPEVDIWSLGCTVSRNGHIRERFTKRRWQIFELTIGYPPFDNSCQKEMILFGNGSRCLEICPTNGDRR